ncbi:MAG TPA: DUF732 domain-containing protein [Nocardia sp.]|uniref:DUF732 domain-containing protein n=1 Tax=Nocardia TaxID=1817 RepID=UPI0024567504|nr:MULTISPECIES: DUF732 domain-containing protein [Nocardia]HLS79481.1 DUF732 domain-containing protein [Nocardia sp.]
MRTHLARSRVLAALLAVPAVLVGASTLVSGSVAPAVAAPDLPSASPELPAAVPDKPSAATHSGGRSALDRQFLRQSFFDDEPVAVQDAAIKLARSQCAYLDSAGNRPADHIYLAESAVGTVEYPHLFLEAAIRTYCPHNRLL